MAVAGGVQVSQAFAQIEGRWEHNIDRWISIVTKESQLLYRTIVVKRGGAETEGEARNSPFDVASPMFMIFW